MNVAVNPRLRFKLNWLKTIEAIDLLARLKDGITQYYVGKLLYFADKEHLLDYGRPITGDRYVAMEHGPVPSAVRDILKADAAVPDECIQAFDDRIETAHVQNRIYLTSKKTADFKLLSGSEQEYLRDAVHKYGNRTFGELKALSHDDAWQEAWDNGVAYTMNPATWLKDLDADVQNSALAYLADRRVRSV